jgi:hypothetical protein
VSVYAIKKPGRVNSVSVSLLLVLAGIGYAGWALVPVYWPYFQLGGMMRGVCYEAYRNADDAALIKRLLADGKRTGLALGPEDFELERVPFAPEELAAQTAGNPEAARILGARGKECVIRFRHATDRVLPLIGKSVRLSFSTEKRVTLETITWEKACTCVSVPGRASAR